MKEVREEGKRTSGDNGMKSMQETKGDDHADSFNAGVEMNVGNCMLPTENGGQKNPVLFCFFRKGNFLSCPQMIS